MLILKDRVLEEVLGEEWEEVWEMVWAKIVEVAEWDESVEAEVVEWDVKIAFTAAGKDWDAMIDQRFGRTEYIVVYDEATEQLSVIDNSAVKNEAHGAGTATSQKIFELNPNVLITGNGPGDNAAIALEKMDIKIFVGAKDLTLKQAYDQYKNGSLKKF